MSGEATEWDQTRQVLVVEDEAEVESVRWRCARSGKVDRYLWQWPGELGSPEVWPLQLFCGKKPPQRPTAWGGSDGGSAACDWLYTQVQSLGRASSLR